LSGLGIKERGVIRPIFSEREDYPLAPLTGGVSILDEAQATKEQGSRNGEVMAHPGDRRKSERKITDEQKGISHSSVSKSPKQVALRKFPKASLPTKEEC